MRTDPSVHRRLERAVQRFGNESLEAASAWAKLASTHQRRKEYLPALSAYGRAWRIRQATLGSDCVLVANVRQSMGVINLRLAEELAVAGRSYSSNLLRAITSLSEAHRERAVTHLSEAHQVKSSRLGAGHIDTADALYQLGLACASAGRLDESISHLLVSLEIRSVVLGDENLVLVETLETIASVHLLREEYGPAMQALASATRSRILIHGRDRDRNRQTHRQALAAFDLQFRVFLSRWETQEYELAVLAFHESTRIAQRYFVHVGEDLEQMSDDHRAWVARIGNWKRFAQSRNASTSQDRELPTSTQPDANSQPNFIRDPRTHNHGVPTSVIPLLTSNNPDIGRRSETQGWQDHERQREVASTLFAQRLASQTAHTSTVVETERRHQTAGTDLTAGNGMERWRTVSTNAVNENTHTHSENQWLENERVLVAENLALRNPLFLDADDLLPNHDPDNSGISGPCYTLLLGNTGVGKSALLHGLIGKPILEADQLHKSEPGRLCVDTPGLSDVRSGELDSKFGIFAGTEGRMAVVSEVENNRIFLIHSEITRSTNSERQRRANETKTGTTRSDQHENNGDFSSAGGGWAGRQIFCWMGFLVFSMGLALTAGLNGLFVSDVGPLSEAQWGADDWNRKCATRHSLLHNLYGDFDGDLFYGDAGDMFCGDAAANLQDARADGRRADYSGFTPTSPSSPAVEFNQDPSDSPSAFPTPISAHIPTPGPGRDSSIKPTRIPSSAPAEPTSVPSEALSSVPSSVPHTTAPPSVATGVIASSTNGLASTVSEAERCCPRPTDQPAPQGHPTRLLPRQQASEKACEKAQQVDHPRFSLQDVDRLEAFSCVMESSVNISPEEHDRDLGSLVDVPAIDGEAFETTKFPDVDVDEALDISEFNLFVISTQSVKLNGTEIARYFDGHIDKTIITQYGADGTHTLFRGIHEYCPLFSRSTLADLTTLPTASLCPTTKQPRRTISPAATSGNGRGGGTTSPRPTRTARMLTRLCPNTEHPRAQRSSIRSSHFRSTLPSAC